MTTQDDKVFSENPYRNLNVLVVDDDMSIRTMVDLVLQDAGFMTEMAENGRVALEKIAAKKFDLVLTDIQMPELKGTELLEKIKRGYPEVEVVMMTSNVSLDSALKALHAGAYDYIEKPFKNIDDVLKVLKNIGDKIVLKKMNTRLLANLKKKNELLGRLYEYSKKISRLMDKKEIIMAALEELHLLFNGVDVVFLFHDRYSRKLVDALAYPKPVGFEFSYQFGNENIVEEGEKYREFLHEHFADREILIDPVITENQLAGFIVIFGMKSDHYDQDIKNAVSQMVSQMETALERANLHQDLKSLAYRDGLTRLYNHRYFQERLEQEISSAMRQKHAVSLVMIDVDNFKKYNDTHGHPMGDKLLMQLASLIGGAGEGTVETRNRITDIAVRYGGEEFALILPYTDKEGARIKAERVRDRVEKSKFEKEETQPGGKVTISLGFATFPSDVQSKDELIRKADAALYEAKRNGKNRVCGTE